MIRIEKLVMSSEDLRKMQLIQLNMLIEFDKVCRKYNIKYILDAGTLLGAVRHSGFIPWDDDIDVRMLRSEYEKFCSIGAKDLEDNIFFQSNKTDKHYLWIYSKLRKKGTKAIRVGQEHLKMKSGMFIDIFPCDGVPNNRILLKMRNIIATVCRKILYARVGKCSADTKKERFFWKCVSVIPKVIPHMIIKILSKCFDEKKCNKFGCMGWHAPKDNNGFKKEWFTELIDVSFEGYNFLAPRDYDGFLKYSFGEDYMTPPPLEKQKATSPLSFYSFDDK